MTIFAILMPSPQPALVESIKTAFPNDFLEVSPTQWLVSFRGTVNEVSNKIGVTGDAPPKGLLSSLLLHPTLAARRKLYGIGSKLSWSLHQVPSFQDQEATPPTNMANVTPMDSGSAQTRQIVDAVKASIAPLENEVKAIRDYRYTDLLLHIGAFTGGIVIVVTMMIAAYFRLDDKLTSVSTSNTRIETKLEDLLARIPPVPTPPRKP